MLSWNRTNEKRPELGNDVIFAKKVAKNTVRFEKEFIEDSDQLDINLAFNDFWFYAKEAGSSFGDWVI